MSKRKNLSEAGLTELPSSMEGYRFGIVRSAWNHEITEKLEVGALKTLLSYGVKQEDIHLITVPGSFELVYGAKILQKKFKPHAILCLGCIIKGETPHDVYISQAVAQGIMDLNIAKNTPIIFGVLTTKSYDQAMERAGGSHGNKGIEAALTGLYMAVIKP